MSNLTDAQGNDYLQISPERDRRVISVGLWSSRD